MGVRSERAGRTHLLVVTVAVAAWIALFCSYQLGWDLFWDLRSYHAAAVVTEAGGDPYDVEVLDQAVPRNVRHPYVYPPWTLVPLRLLAHLDYGTLVLIHGALVGICLALFTAILVRGLSIPPARALLVLAFGFGASAWIGLRSGNVQIATSLLCLVGVYRAEHAGRWGVAAPIGLATAVKLQPGLLLLTATAAGSWRPTRPALLVAVTLACLLLGPFVIDPGAQARFFDVLNSMDERGVLSPSTWNVLRGIGEELGLPVDAQWIVYLLVASALGLVGIKVLLRSSGTTAARLALTLSTYAICLPRWKDYAGILIVPAALAVWPDRPRLGTIWLVLLIAPIPAFADRLDGLGRAVLSYWSWYLLLTTWILSLRACLRSSPIEDATASTEKAFFGD